MLLGTMHIPDKDHYNPSETQLSSAIYRPFHDNSTYNDRDPKNPPNWLLGQDTKGGKTRNAHSSRGMKEHSLRETNADQNGCTWIFLLCVKFVPFHPENLQKGKSFTYIWKIQVYLITIYSHYSPQNQDGYPYLLQTIIFGHLFVNFFCFFVSFSSDFFPPPAPSSEDSPISLMFLQPSVSGDTRGTR